MKKSSTLLLALIGLGALLAGFPSSATAPLPNAALTTATSGTPIDQRTTQQNAADSARAKVILGELKKKYRYLGDVTVTIGTTPHGEEAVAYYTEGQIVISRSHTVTLERILAHEIWHVIDWRDNGRIDWHENLPPRNPSHYFSGSLPDRLDSGTTGPAV